MVSDRFGFGSVQFRISGQNRFNFFSRRFGSGFGSFGSGQLDRVTFSRSNLSSFSTFDFRISVESKDSLNKFGFLI